MGVVRIIKHILEHPFASRHKARAVSNFVSFQLKKRISSDIRAYDWINGLKLFAGPGMTGVTGNLYCGLYEYEDMTFLLHFLRNYDLFVDIGANHGVYSILAAGIPGSGVHAFEPIPSTSRRFRNNIKLNRLEDLIVLHPYALGSQNQTVQMRTDLDTMNHISTEKDSGPVVNIEVRILDEVLAGKSPSLLKIDVEGYESEVLKGSNAILSNPALKAIIIEMNSSGEKYGTSDASLESLIISHGFAPHRYDPSTRIMRPGKRSNGTNEIYVRDVEFVSTRLKKGKRVEIWGEEI